MYAFTTMLQAIKFFNCYTYTCCTPVHVHVHVHVKPTTVIQGRSCNCNTQLQCQLKERTKRKSKITNELAFSVYCTLKSTSNIMKTHHIVISNAFPHSTCCACILTYSPTHTCTIHVHIYTCTYM